MRRGVDRWALLSCLLMVGGCGGPGGSSTAPCTTDSQCGSGWQCTSEGACVRPDASDDAGGADASADTTSADTPAPDTTGAFPRIHVLVGNQALGDSGGEVSFGQALQLPVTKEVQVINPGFVDLTIEDIDWKRSDGEAVKNPYVEIDWGNVVDEFPRLIAAGNTSGLRFDVRYTPPAGGPLDDFSDSVLVLESDARTASGDSLIPALEITFSVPATSAGPRMSPPSYTFSNATTTQPETQTFRVGSDPDRATDPFMVTEIEFESPSDVFSLTTVPALPAEILAPDEPGYAELEFEVTYQPEGPSGDDNAVLVHHDQSDEPVRVPLEGDGETGSYEVSFSQPTLRFDFTNESEEATRAMVLSSLGPGPITVRRPRIEPQEAENVYSYEALNSVGDPIGSWPQALTTGRSIEFLVTYEPPAGSIEPPNGQLVIPVNTPGSIELTYDLLAGSPKPKIRMAPSNNLGVSGSAAAGDSGTASVVIYNEGNGDLEIKNAYVSTGGGRAAKVFSLSGEETLGSDTVVPPDGLRVVEVDWDLAELGSSLTSESLSIQYHDPLLAHDVETFFILIATDVGQQTPPTADPGDAEDYSGAAAGEILTLDGSGSTGGDYDISGGAFNWYLVDKPEGARATLHTLGGEFEPFVPDTPGSYTVELFVVGSQGAQFAYSVPARVTLEVE